MREAREVCGFRFSRQPRKARKIMGVRDVKTARAGRVSGMRSLSDHHHGLGTLTSYPVQHGERVGMKWGRARCAAGASGATCRMRAAGRRAASSRSQFGARARARLHPPPSLDSFTQGACVCVCVCQGCSMSACPTKPALTCVCVLESGGARDTLAANETSEKEGGGVSKR